MVSFSVVGSAPLPVTLRLVATAEGYYGSSTTVQVKDEKPVSGEVRLVTAAAPPVGAVGVTTVSGATTPSGATTAPIAVATPPAAPTQGSTAISVPSGTTITSSSGQPLTGNLSWQVTYFDPGTPSSLAAFPGGQTVTLPPPAGGAPQTGAFVTAGFTSVELKDEAGRVATTFDQPVTVRLNVPADTVNPRTKAPVAPGNSIQVLSYSTRTGQWSDEGATTVRQDAGGPLYVDALVSHFSYFGTGWLEPTCGGIVRTNVVMSPEWNLQLDIIAPQGGWATWNMPFDYGSAQVYGLPREVPLDFVITSLGVEVGRASIQDICTTSDVLVELFQPWPKYGAMEVTVYSACWEDQSVRTPQASATVTVQRMNASTGQMGESYVGWTDKDGKARIGLLMLGDYSVRAQTYSSPMGGSFLSGFATVRDNATTQVELVEVVTTCQQTGASGGG